MSDPYNQGGYGQNYNQGYPHQGQGYPQQQYGGGGGGYDQNYPQQGAGYGGYQNQGGYGQQPYGAQQGYGAPPAPDYAGGQNQTGSYGGPPQHGGFTHGQGPPQYGQDYNQQGQYGQQGPYSQQQQTQPWGQGAPPSGDPANPYGYTRDPADPNNPQEGERGFMGAMAGGIGGGLLGHKAGHGIIGALAGAFLGSKGEDKWKEHSHNKPHGGYGGSGSGYGKW
ncbi:Hypothetical predicted protein [Lecanosticta acicola]|uniref:Glycine zipper 2TM domain-containing protein n=1 Tax=Lecanosticta acicola TaxID=111012 RepID=A0AAI8Z3Q4_9PEZI|nr:Hypothetical predicted protein [Lecanosticta acicola]